MIFENLECFIDWGCEIWWEIDVTFSITTFLHTLGSGFECKLLESQLMVLTKSRLLDSKSYVDLDPSVNAS